MIVRYGDFYGVGGKTKLVPPGVLADQGFRKLSLDMDEETFRNAPTSDLSDKEGPPNVALMSDVYRYYGQVPYFSESTASRRASRVTNADPLGYVVKGSKILLMPVDNLQGERLGIVVGLRDLNNRTGKFTGVVISPWGMGRSEGTRILTPRSLRYDLNRKGLRLNDAAESFTASPAFFGLPGYSSTGNGDVYLQERARYPEILFPAPLAQGNSRKDRLITSDIKRRISQNDDLSHYAKNIEVGTVAGQVTLQSRVEDSSDRDQLITCATQVVGRRNVNDQLTVKAMTQNEKNRDR